MNERILELAERVKVIMDGDDDLEFYTEKFAELLIQECIGLCMNVNGDLPRTEPLVAASIKKHFGVE